MKRDPIAKMYDKLTTKQQAALAFNHLMTGNQIETERVISAVPIKSYRCKDSDFQDQFESYRVMALLWSVEYWQLYAQQLETLVRLNLYTRRKDWIKADQAHEQLEHVGSCLSAIDRALKSVCEAQGLDSAAVRLMAGCRPSTVFAPDLAYESEVREQLKTVVSPRIDA
jgi:hypothetical protein